MDRITRITRKVVGRKFIVSPRRLILTNFRTSTYTVSAKDLEFVRIYGRQFSTYKPTYPIPCDEQEQDNMGMIQKC